MTAASMTGVVARVVKPRPRSAGYMRGPSAARKRSIVMGAKVVARMSMWRLPSLSLRLPDRSAPAAPASSRTDRATFAPMSVEPSE